MFDYNSGHVIGAINIVGSKLMKRRLSANVVCIRSQINVVLVYLICVVLLFRVR